MRVDCFTGFRETHPGQGDVDGLERRREQRPKRTYGWNPIQPEQVDAPAKTGNARK